MYDKRYLVVMKIHIDDICEYSSFVFNFHFTVFQLKNTHTESSLHFLSQMTFFYIFLLYVLHLYANGGGDTYIQLYLSALWPKLCILVLS